MIIWNSSNFQTITEFPGFEILTMISIAWLDMSSIMIDFTDWFETSMNTKCNYCFSWGKDFLLEHTLQWQVQSIVIVTWGKGSIGARNEYCFWDTLLSCIWFLTCWIHSNYRNVLEWVCCLHWPGSVDWKMSLKGRRASKWQCFAGCNTVQIIYIA